MIKTPVWREIFHSASKLTQTWAAGSFSMGTRIDKIASSVSLGVLSHKMLSDSERLSAAVRGRSASSCTLHSPWLSGRTPVGLRQSGGHPPDSGHLYWTPLDVR